MQGRAEGARARGPRLGRLLSAPRTPRRPPGRAPRLVPSPPTLHAPPGPPSSEAVCRPAERFRV